MGDFDDDALGILVRMLGPRGPRGDAGAAAKPEETSESRDTRAASPAAPVEKISPRISNFPSGFPIRLAFASRSGRTLRDRLPTSPDFLFDDLLSWEIPK